MDIKQLTALIGVEEYGGFSNAASVLGTVQSNISTHVSKLEAELDVILVDRRTGTLTIEGSAVAARARLILKEIEAIQSDLFALKNDVRGTVRMGMIGTTARWLIPVLLPELAKRHPNLHIEVSEGTTTSLEARLQNGTLDLALVNKPTYSEDFAFRTLFEERYVLVIPSNHPLSKRQRVNVSDLDGIELIVPPRGIPIRDLLDTLSKRSNTNFKVLAEVDGIRTISSITFDGYGPSIIPATAVPHYLRESWTTIPVEDLPNRRIGVSKRKRALDSAPMVAVLAVLDEIFSEHAESVYPIPEGIHKLASRLNEPNIKHSEANKL